MPVNLAFVAADDLLQQGQKLLVQEKVREECYHDVHNMTVVECLSSATLQVDPTIIGGIVIDIGDKHIDLSIASRIKKIQQMVLQNV